LIRVLQQLEVGFHLIKFFLVVLGAVSILIQEQVKVNDIIEFKLGIVFDQLLVLDVVVYSVELEHQDIWWPAYPRL